MLQPYNSCIEVDLGEIGRNIDKIRKGIGPGMDIIAVLKGNAYGMGTAAIGKFLTTRCGIKALACAQSYEAWRLREAGISADLFVMGGVPFHNIPAVVTHDLQTPAYNMEYLNMLNSESIKQGKVSQVHIKIETGLNRVGVWPGEQTDELCSFLKTLKNVRVVGIFTHFVQSELADKSYTYEQLRLFKIALAQAKKHDFDLRYIHVANTAASTWLKDPDMTHIRPAGLLFGYDVNVEPKNYFGLNEVMTWRTFVTNVKDVKAGESVGYRRAFVADKTTTVATISAGYGDGYTRSLAVSGLAEVLVHGKRARIIGTCMDQTFIDVTGIPVNVNDTVTLIGKDGDEFISVFELERNMGQTYLATTSVISERVARLYKE